ncbi:MAG: hypothetical protein WDW38_000643 [Sanguina aurantia]
MLTGVRIWSEVPVIRKAVKDQYTQVESLLAGLDPTQRDAYYQLCDCRHTDGPVSARGIFLSNNYGLGNPASEAGVFLTISRFNHSCSPSCTHVWDPQEGVKHVRVGRDVKCGEELTLSYLRHQSMGWDARQEILSVVYNFTCSCEACKLTGLEREASDRRRTRVGVLTDGMQRAFDTRQFRKALQMAEEHLRLLVEEGVALPRFVHAVQEDAYQACRNASRHGEARVWLARAHGTAVLADGADSRAAQQIARLLALS